MTSIAIVTNGIASTLNSSLALARRLADRGHRVTFLCHVDVGREVEANGFTFVHLTAPREAWASIRAPLERCRERPSLRTALGLLTVPARAWRARRATTRADELVAVLSDLDPELLVIDIEAHVAVLASSRLGIPTVLTTFLFCVTRQPGVPPLDTPLLPADREATDRAWSDNVRSRRRARWRRRLSRRGIVDLVGPVHYSTTSPDALAAVARRSGFDLATRVDEDQWLRPHVYVDLPVLSTNLWELEFDHRPPPNWTYVGPMVDLRRVDVAADESQIARWRAFRDGRAPSRPLVYCSLGSYWTADASFLVRVIDVFRRRSDWDLVVGLGNTIDEAALGPLPDNVLVLSWAPQVEVLGTARAAIIHGGNAGLNECVVQGVPPVVYSTGHLDQNGVAARVAFHGIGVVGASLADHPATIEREIERVLDDPAITGRIRAMQELARHPERLRQAPTLLEAAVGS